VTGSPDPVVRTMDAVRPGTSRSELGVQRAGEVLDAAAAVFSRLGYDGSSIDDVADELGATKGRVYHYFRSKADLLLGVLTVGAQRLINLIRPIAQDMSLAPQDKLRRMARAHAMTMMTEHAYHRVGLQAFDQLFAKGPRQAEWETVLELRGEYEQLYLSVVEEGQAAGAFAEANPRVVVRGLLGALNWLTVWYRPATVPVTAPRLSDEEIADTTAGFVVAGAIGLVTRAGTRNGQVLSGPSHGIALPPSTGSTAPVT
jgi:AcrR family transcriptional regulator